ncbi:unnamed protein product [Meganyctiphanes norvegica]|uniref:BED-type domain-containing protein n=1 Tax=Meganyctiphanes norvegica TaxID=48144 RepID=A0AAV2QTK9_MEGNR
MTTATTEIVDKTLIERLILEHSDRLELEINQKARADAWKFYYRVRVDHVVRPFAVCKVCFRVLHCDSRSGTASLLRHPCNPLSERSPVNRAVKLNAKLNLPADQALKDAAAKEKSDLLKEADGGDSARSSPVSMARGSPTSTGSPPTAAQPTNSAAAARKRKTANAAAASAPAGPTFPLDLRLLQLPQLVAAMASAQAHPMLNLANLPALLADPLHLQRIQQYREQIQQHQQQHQQRERDEQEHREREEQRERTEQLVKRARMDGLKEERPNSPYEASSSSNAWGLNRVKKEHADTSEPLQAEDLRASTQPKKQNGRGRGQQTDDGVPGLAKEAVQQLVTSGSPRVKLSDKDSAGSHYISDVWARFSVVSVDSVIRPFASCKSCLKVVTYTKYSGTGGLLRHRCSAPDLLARTPDHKPQALLPPMQQHPPELNDPPPIGDSPPPVAHFPAHHGLAAQQRSAPSSPVGGDLLDSIRLGGEVVTTAAQAGVARALLKYMCQDLMSPSTLDTPAFQRLVWTILNLGAAHGTFREEEPLPSGRQLLGGYLAPVACESRAAIARTAMDYPSLCLSLHRQEGCLAAALHYITPKFQLRNHAMGARLVREGETEEEGVTALLGEFFSDVLVASAMRDKHITVVSDCGTPSEPGVVGVHCVWHSTEAILEELPDHPSYRKIIDEVAAIISFLQDSGLSKNSLACPLNPQDIRAWDVLLLALNFVITNYEELRVAVAGTEGATGSLLGDKQVYQELAELLTGVKLCLQTMRDGGRPTLNQAVLCRAKLLQLCQEPAANLNLRGLKTHLTKQFTKTLELTPLHHVASFLDPRCKSLKVLEESEKCEVHRHVLEMMKSVAVTEANSGVLNLKTTKNNTAALNTIRSPRNEEVPTSSANGNHPFREYMDNPAPDTSVSDSEEIMAYVNMKVQIDDDDILGWWAGPNAGGLPTLRLLARKILAVPATCSYAHDLATHAHKASAQMGLTDTQQLNNVLHMKYNMS